LLHFEIFQEPTMSKHERIIEKIRECANQREVVESYREYLEKVEAQLAKGVRERSKEARVGEVMEVTEETARRVSDPAVRDFLSKAAHEVGKKYGVDARIMILPPYEERFRGEREWREKDNRRFGKHIYRICGVIIQLARERIDDRFTAHDLYRRVPEVSFVVDPLLDQLEKMGFLELGFFAFMKYGEKEERKVMRLKREWESEQEMADEVMTKLGENGQIPYEMIHIGCSSDYIEWQK